MTDEERLKELKKKLLLLKAKLGLELMIRAAGSDNQDDKENLKSVSPVPKQEGVPSTKRTD
jgi:hypothetical protein